MAKKTVNRKTPKNCIWCYGDFKLGLDDYEVKELFKDEFGSKWYSKYRKFNRWMRGQTTGLISHPKLNISVVYRCDVNTFIEAELNNERPYNFD